VRATAEAESKKMRFRLALGYLGVGLLGLIIGFFVGREYLKYELRSAFSSAVGDFKKDLTTLGNGGTPSPTTATGPLIAKPTETKLAPPFSMPAPKESPPVEIVLIKKGFKPSNLEAQDFEDDITLSLAIKNLSGRNIRAFDGIVHFTDLLGNEIMPMKLAINEPIAAGSSLNWDGGIRYNQFSEADQRLRAAASQNMKLNFVVAKVLFADGTTKEYGER
jgi:hypothetical protein